MSDQYLGEIRMFAGNFAPSGWALCDGQILAIRQNTALFSLLGTTYGGDGTSTFKLPDLRGRVPIHPGQGPGLSTYTLGEMAGTESVTLLLNQMPMHNHLQAASSSTQSSQADPTNAFCGTDNETAVYSTAANTTMAPQSIGMAGGNQAHPNIQPFLCVTFIIALQGIFPSRP